jgi:mRNA-degrading endonuclease HigB of HigAB toxin-antitoxin module
MTIYNVLFKSVEKKETPFCQAFKTELEARNFCELVCKKNNFTIKSTMGWNVLETFDDYRVEDVNGNSYYLVIYKQTI